MTSCRAVMNPFSLENLLFQKTVKFHVAYAAFTFLSFLYPNKFNEEFN